MIFVMIGAQVNYYFEEQFRWIHQNAVEAIRKEYQLLTREEDDEEPEEDLPTELPSTGPEAVAGSVIALGSLGTATGYYVVSRRRLR